MKALPLLATAMLTHGIVLSAPALALAPAAPAPIAQCPPGPPPPPPPPPPPGGDDAGPGTGAPSAPTTPRPNFPAPSGPAPSAPSTPSPGSPDAPRPSGPLTGGGSPAAGPTAGGEAFSPTPIGSFDDDQLHWSHWWYLESARFLDLRKNIQGPVAPSGRTVVLTAPRAPSRKVVEAHVIPRLLEIANEERSDPMVAAALLSLGRLAKSPGDQQQQAIAAARRHLSASNRQVRESAIVALGLFGQKECNNTLIEILRGTPEAVRTLGTTSIPTRTRSFAAHALGLSAVRVESAREKQRIAVALIDVLEGKVSNQIDLPVAAVSSLGLIGLPQRLTAPSNAVRKSEHVDHVLASRNLARYLRPFLEKTAGDRADRTPTVRAHAAVAFARAAAGSDEATRADAIERLIALGANRAEHMNLRTSASIALGEVARAGEAEADREARRHLLTVAKKGQPIERRFAAIAAAASCTRTGDGESPLDGAEDVRRQLMNELGRGRSGELGWTSLALGMLEDSMHRRGVETSKEGRDVLAAIGKKKRSDDDSAALGIGLALATRNTDRVQRTGEHILNELKHTSTPELRGNLLMALGLAEYKPAASFVREELEGAGANAVLLWSAAVSLGLMGEPVSKDLVAMMGESQSAPELMGISAALGQVGTANAVQPLLDLLAEEDRPQPMRAAAVEALGAVCDLDRLPWRDPIAHALPYFAGTPTLASNGFGLLERPW